MDLSHFHQYLVTDAFQHVESPPNISNLMAYVQPTATYHAGQNKLHGAIGIRMLLDRDDKSEKTILFLAHKCRYNS